MDERPIADTVADFCPVEWSTERPKGCFLTDVVYHVCWKRQPHDGPHRCECGDDDG